MGRYAAPPVAGVVAAPTAKQRALQNGTPKWLPQGEARACYALASFNTSSQNGGAVFFDKFFQPVRPLLSPQSAGSPNPGNTQFNNQGDLTYLQQTFQNVYAGTQSNPSSNGTSNWMNATNAAGEFGNAMIDAYSNGTLAPVMGRGNDINVKHYLNHMFVDSDHADKTIVYLLNGTTFRACARIDGDYSYDYYGTQPFGISGINGNMYGSASYNNVRKELAILSYSASGGAFDLILYKGIDFDKYPSPAAAFTQPGVTRVNKTVSLSGNWNVNNNESYYSIKPVLCDDGTIYATVMFTGSTFGLYRILRDASDNLTPGHISNKTLTTSYGREQAMQYGQRRIQSRDGGAVCCFCAYYYYGCGVSTWVIDKRKSAYINSSTMDSANSSVGMMPVPYGDSGFACYYAGNYYASAYNGAYVTGMIERTVNGGLGNIGNTIYLPYAPMPNTTNYPALTQVVDYALLDNQALV